MKIDTVGRKLFIYSLLCALTALTIKLTKDSLKGEKQIELIFTRAYRNISPVAQSVKSLSAMQETWVGFLGREDPLEMEMATNPYFCPGNPLDRGVWQGTVHCVARVEHALATKSPPP